MPVFSASCRKGGNQRMAYTGEKPFALATIIRSIFAEDLCHSVACCRRRYLDAKAASHPFPKAIPPLAPFGRRVTFFSNSGAKSGFSDLYGAKGIEYKEPNFFSFCRARINHNRGYVHRSQRRLERGGVRR